MARRGARWGSALATGLLLLLSACGDGNSDDFLWGRTPSFTPDGLRLFYSQNLSTPSDRFSGTVTSLDAGVIWRIDRSGLNPLKITPDGRGPDFFPKVSPDGRQIGFICGENGWFNLWVMDADGFNRRQLTFDQAIETTPAWSPDGDRLVFVSDRSGNNDIWSVRLDGSGLTQLTSLPSDEAAPEYSPDGSTIAFASNMDRSNFDLWLMDAGGGNLRQVTRKDNAATGTSDGGPTWAPDGATLVFERWEGNWELYAVRPDGSTLTRLTANDQHDGDPVYSPDGGSIAFTSSRTGWWQVFLMDANGANPRQLTGAGR
ncbi:MAG: PD40 domain-containing protein [Fimbriimonadaceae bacterium]|nr:PD40 domain-containing protein [Fimbriimonadaceae bacterium]